MKAIVILIRVVLTSVILFPLLVAEPFAGEDYSDWLLDLYFRWSGEDNL